MADNDQKWIGRALAGSEAAYSELLHAYQRPVYTLILRMVRDPGLAEDLAQDSFVKAFRNLASYDRSRKFSSWLFKIAHNTAIDHLRRRSVATVPLEGSGDGDFGPLDSVLDESAENPEAAVRRLDLARALEEAVAQLRPDYRQVVLLRFQAGMAYDEIAEATGLPMGTVKTHIHRARKKLCALLEAMGVQPES
jgi:RNA polymerase sigma-70 factor (ECF subfamily)